MKKLTRKKLDELSQIMPVLSADLQRVFIGGGYGTLESPYTIVEFQGLFDSGAWHGGYVEGMGYVFADGTANGNSDGNFGYPYPDSGSEGLSGSYGYWWGNGISGGLPDDTYEGISGSMGHESGSYSYNNDGIDVDNNKHFIFKFDKEEHRGFEEQLKEMLRNSSIAKNLSGYFVKGCLNMEFRIEELPDNTTAHTVPSPDPSKPYVIVFNSKYINKNGWTIASSGIDNMGYDHSKSRNTKEELLITTIHELMHANHDARFYDAMIHSKNSPDNARQFLLDNGYSQEFTDAYFEKKNGKWYIRDQESTLKALHAYMEKYNHGVIDAALEEHRKDHKPQP